MYLDSEINDDGINKEPSTATSLPEKQAGQSVKRQIDETTEPEVSPTKKPALVVDLTSSSSAVPENKAPKVVGTSTDDVAKPEAAVDANHYEASLASAGITPLKGQKKDALQPRNTLLPGNRNSALPHRDLRRVKSF